MKRKFQVSNILIECKILQALKMFLKYKKRPFKKKRFAI